jgi:hypothetical protein
MGLLQLISNDKLAEQEASPVLPAVVVSDLAAHIRKQWEVNKAAKLPIEREMLEDLRQRNGEYDPEDLADIREQGGSEIYMMLTATKCRAAASWITDILFPTGEKAWGIEPTPIPELSTEIQQYVALRLRAEAESLVDEGINPSPEQLEQRRQQIENRIRIALDEKAWDANDKMEKKIEDQLEESGWQSAMLEFIDDFVTFPAAVLKGPVYRKRLQLKWGSQGEPITEYKIVTSDERVSPFDIFPSPGAVDPDDGVLIERVRYSRGDLYEMIGVPGYSEEAIRRVLDQHSAAGLQDWETGSETEIDRLAVRHSNTVKPESITGLHYWGSAPGKVLMDWGVTGKLDPQREYEIEAILIGTEVVRAMLNHDPLLRRPYYKASFQRRPGSFWGISPPRLMRDIARMCNATARSLANNMGMSSGPQVVVMKDMLAQGEVLTQLYPWKQWQMTTLQSQQGVQPIQFFQPQSNAGELLTVYKEFEARADDATNIPRYAYGNEKVAGAGVTAQGLAMLLEAASKGIKQAIRHVDDGVIQPRVERQYQHNMLYDPDVSIKGDLRVIARGSSALIAKAATQARRNEFLQITANPIDMQLIGLEGRAELLRQMVADMDLDPELVPDRDAIKQKQEQMAQQGPKDPQMAIAQMRLQAEKEKLEMQLRDNEMERQAKVAIASMSRDGDMMELAEKGKLTLEQIKAKLGEVAIKERGARQRIADEAAIKARFGSGI